ncbi:MAG: AmmeMemoRadiSam system radical SAM enzyme [Candidatus Buchananbacteria bacterium]
MPLKEAQFYEILDAGRVKCRLCCHYCIIAPDRFGHCGVRRNIDGRLYTYTYGRPVAVNIDPIEKKPLRQFLPGTMTYSLGTFGCNFHCANCQNYDISQVGGAEETLLVPPLIAPEQIVTQAIENNCPSISYTYSEPTIFAEYALDIMKLARERGLKNIWVSNGFMSPECRREIVPYLDAANIDLKSFDPEFYLKVCQAKLEPVLENLQAVKAAGVHLEITTLIVPTLSDEERMLKDLAGFIVQELGAETPWHLLRFSPEAAWKLKQLPATAQEAIAKAKNLGVLAGLKNIYV